MSKKDKEYLEKIYFDPKSPASFSGVNKLFHYARKQGEYIPRKVIQKWLQSQEVHTTNRLVKQKFERRRVIAPYIDYMWDMDVASLRDLSGENRGFGYFLLAIDIMSRFVFCEPIKTTSAIAIKKAISSIFNNKRFPERIRTDKGSEFVNTVVDSFLKKYNIIHFVTQNEVKANYAERAIQTIKGKLMRYMRANQTKKWVDRLNDVTYSYNNTLHRSIKRKPSSITKKDEQILWKRLYASKPPIFKGKKPFRFEVGDVVRITRLRHPFQRYYSEHWTNELFFIERRDFQQYIPTYVLSDYARDPIKGIFYESELQKVYVDENTLYNIEKIVDTRRNKGRGESRVRWMGWPEKFDTWIPTKNLKQYKK